MADRRAKYEQTGEPKHLEYENAFKRELAKKGKANPEIRRNFFLEDTVEEGNFVAAQRLLSCARGADMEIPMQELYLGGDWARKSDYSWFALTNEMNDVVDWLKLPHVTRWPRSSKNR